MRVYFVSDGTGITAETLGNALLSQFPGLVSGDGSARTVVPFVDTPEHARRVAAGIRNDTGPDSPALVLTTVLDPAVSAALADCGAPVVDLFAGLVTTLEGVLGRPADRTAGRAHAVGDPGRYTRRMQAVEFALAHDDGQTPAALERADVILIGPSRCGKTPTSTYLALQHGVFAANYPLVDEDLDGTDLPTPLRGRADACFGLLSTAQRLHEVRTARRPGSPYASLSQCTHELRRAEALYRAHGIPYVTTAGRSVEEISAVVLQALDQAPTRSTSTSRRRSRSWQPTSSGSPNSASTTSPRWAARTPPSAR